MAEIIRVYLPAGNLVMEKKPLLSEVVPIDFSLIEIEAKGMASLVLDCCTIPFTVAKF